MVVDSKQARLARALYRGISRWNQKLAPNASLHQFHRQLAGFRIENPATLQQALRVAFRQQQQDGDPKLQIRQAMEGLKFVNEINLDKLEEAPKESKESSTTTSTKQQASIITTTSSSSVTGVQHLLDAVNWLPSISHFSDIPVEPMIHLPLFPLSGPVLPEQQQQGINDIILPLFTPMSDIPVPGMEITLKIFEPRYRDLYHDAIASKRKRFVVPFAHPTLPGVYASHGLLYEITRIEDVADQTNGQVQLLCHHLVTKTVRIDKIVNPSAWTTFPPTTYLRIQGQVLIEEETVDHIHQMAELQAVLKNWKARPMIVDRLLSSLGEGIWPLVNIWINHWQMELLQMQVGISAEVKVRLESSDDDGGDSKEQQQEKADQIIANVQAPHRERLVSLQTELATLVPRLLQLDSKAQCEFMCGIFRKEQVRLQHLELETI
jgi:hypothetical protein